MCACLRCLHLGRRLAGRVSTTCLGLPDTVALLWIDDALDDQRGPHGLDMRDGTGSTSDALPQRAAVTSHSLPDAGCVFLFSVASVLDATLAVLVRFGC